MRIKIITFVILGSVSLALGTVGIFLPILPTVPFYLLTLFFFANSSQRLHRWFLGTRLYEKHLASYVSGKGMTARTKAGMITAATLLMGFGFAMMAWKKIWIPCVILLLV
jgi:uncharacterized membrane protein YbaN (DUF454 family)